MQELLRNYISLRKFWGKYFFQNLSFYFKIGESIKPEASSAADKLDPSADHSSKSCSEVSAQEKLNETSSDEELGEVRFTKQAKQQQQQGDQSEDPSTRNLDQQQQQQQILENRTNLARSHIEQAMSSFMPVACASTSKQFPGGDPTNSKPNLSSSSPKPAFSPINFMNSPGPSQSPIPSFNPHNMPFNPLTHSAFSHFFPPEMQHQFQQQQQQHQQHLQKSQRPNQSNSTCSSPTPDQQDDQRAPLPCKVVLNKPPELVKPDSNAMFVRVWDRGSNTCSRTDLNFKYLPNSKYLRSKAETQKQPSGKASSNGNFNEQQHSVNKTNSSSKPSAVNSAFNPDLNKAPVGNPLMNMPMMPNMNELGKLPPHLAPFFNMMANGPHRPMGPSVQERSA